jgi:CubicO group peptidase (beta-lactamase class C family)
MASAGTWVKRILLGALTAVLVVISAAIGFLLFKEFPQNAAAWAAKAVCSGAFVAGRDPDAVYEEDVAGVHPVFKAVSVKVDEATHSVTAKTVGLFPRTATLQPERGCVLELPPDPAAETYVPATNSTELWPAGDVPFDQSDWPAGVDTDGLNKVVDDALVGAGDIAAANARGVAVVQDGKLLVLREAPGFEEGTPLHSWSMAKTVAGMLAYKLLAENEIPLDTPVVEAFQPGREPAWVADWRSDERASITIRQVFGMTDGLANVEGYTPFTDTVAMLYGEPDMAAFAASAPAEYPPGSRFNYTSQTANILAAIARGQLASDEDYWAYPYKAIFDPIGAKSATLETDTSGNWVGSSYLWASTSDWARLGQLGLQDGQWEGTQVLPKGWLDFASTQVLPEGEGAGYSAQAWLPGDPVGGECRDLPGFPEDMVAMEGHWGQKVAMVPSKKAVVVRLGWTFDSDQFDFCTFWNDTLAALPTL